MSATSAEDDDEGTAFFLYTASIGTLVANDSSVNAVGTNNNGTPLLIKTSRELRDDHALRRLNRLKQEEQRPNEILPTSKKRKRPCCYDTFVLRGPYNFASETIQYQPLVVSSVVAASVVDFFTQEAKRRKISDVACKIQEDEQGLSWKALQLWDCEPSFAFLQILQAARSLFSSVEFSQSHQLRALDLLTFGGQNEKLKAIVSP